MDRFVITIGRLCGSGGTFIGQELCRRLGIELYDRNLLSLAAEDSGISEELFANADEKLKSSLIYKVSRSVYKGELIPPESDNFVSNRNLFNYQAKVLKELANRESFVVIGRCADFVLRDHPGLLRVFVTADREFCIRTEEHRLSLSRHDAETRVAKQNKYRAEYYRYYTGQTWDDPRNYDLCLNTGTLSYADCAELIIRRLALPHTHK